MTARSRLIPPIAFSRACTASCVSTLLRRRLTPIAAMAAKIDSAISISTSVKPFPPFPAVGPELAEGPFLLLAPPKGRRSPRTCSGVGRTGAGGQEGAPRSEGPTSDLQYLI